MHRGAHHLTRVAMLSINVQQGTIALEKHARLPKEDGHCRHIHPGDFGDVLCAAIVTDEDTIVRDHNQDGCDRECSEHAREVRNGLVVLL